MDYGKVIRDARAARGWSQTRLAEESGASQSTIARIEKGHTTWSRSLVPIGNALDLDFAEDGSVTIAGARGSYPSEVKVMDQDPHKGSLWAGGVGARGSKMMPLYAAVEGGTGEMIIEKDPIGLVDRPGHLADVQNAYAVYISGESMVPEYDPGDIAQVNPKLPPIPDTTCIFYTNDAADDRALIKRLVKPTQYEWFVRQWNPPEGAPSEFELDRGVWKLCHRVVGRIPRR